VFKLPEKAETTSEKVANVEHHKPWISYRNSRNIDKNSIWIFCDGTTMGCFASIILYPQDTITKKVGYTPQTSTKNVGAELNSVILGLESLVTPINFPVYLVVDYIGTIPWILGKWNINNPEVKDKIDTILKILKEKQIELYLIQHKSHQKDKSDFTLYNNMVDSLCSEENTKWKMKLKEKVDSL